jgi:hypothetical protein
MPSAWVSRLVVDCHGSTAIGIPFLYKSDDSVQVSDVSVQARSLLQGDGAALTSEPRSLTVLVPAPLRLLKDPARKFMPARHKPWA